jgi:hypothetical protein
LWLEICWAETSFCSVIVCGCARQASRVGEV